MPKKKKKNKSSLINKIKKNKMKFSLLEVIIIVLISLSLGTLIGSSFIYTKEKIVYNNIPEELDEFVVTYEKIKAGYYKKIDSSDLIESAIEGMVNSLDDPYTNYMDEDTTEVFNQTVDGEYVGIGATVEITEEEIKIISIIDNSPAKKAGLKVDDIITKINGKEVKGKSNDEISKLLKGKKNTKVKITIKRKEKEKTYTLTRSDVDIPSISSKVIKANDKKIGYIHIDVFAANTYSQFKKNLEKLENKKIDSLIIDVRNNSGGHLDQVTKILEMFMDKKHVLYQIQKGKNKKKVYSSTKEKRNYKVVVLVNKGSASASEILTAAMKESYNAEIIGESTYGKGTVQNSYSLKNGTSLKYTTEKWLTPKGNWINEKGVKPTIEESLTEEYYNNPTEENDNQLQKAIEILK